MNKKEKMIREFSEIKKEAIGKCGEDIVNKLVSAVSNIYEHDLEVMQEKLDDAYSQMSKIYNNAFLTEVENRNLKTLHSEELYRLKLI